MEGWQVKFSGHAVRRMFERSIRRPEVIAVLGSGEVIEDYPNDRPFPSQLLLGFAEGRPLHVAAARDQATRTVHVITAYEPDQLLWSDDYRKRRPS